MKKLDFVIVREGNNLVVVKQKVVFFLGVQIGVELLNGVSKEVDFGKILDIKLDIKKGSFIFLILI